MNTELELQKFLRAEGIQGFERLKETYGITTRQSDVHPELYLFKYSQIDSPMSERIVQESRGIILNGDDNWRVVSRPYDKFFNYNQGHSAKIDWSSAKCYDKLDGSLVTLYWYKGQWNVATSGHPDAAGEVWNTQSKVITFKELFWDTWRSLNYELPMTEGERSFCFMFELMTPLNKIVVHHKSYELVLHGVRNILTGHEHNIDTWSVYGWKTCPTFKLTSIEEILSCADNLNPLEQEGYIVTDKYFNRIKVKSPQYVALHHMVESLCPRSMLEIVRTNEGAEFLQYFPELTDVYNDVKAGYDKLVSYLNTQVTALKMLHPNPSRKDIGLATKGEFWQGIIFPILFDGKSVKNVISNMPIKKLEEWIYKCGLC